MNSITILLVFLIGSINAMVLFDNNNSNSNNPNVGAKGYAGGRLAVSSWAEAGYRWFSKLNCSDQIMLSEENCARIKGIDKSQFRVYAAQPVQDKKYDLVFPDGDTKYKTFHDGVVVLDPFPAARFGHPILVFNVDKSPKNVGHCESTKGIISDDAACLQVVTRSFNNKLSYNYRSRLLPMTSVNWGEVQFLPLVYLQTELPVQTNDKLECYSHLDGFNQSCPHLRPKSETSNISCDPILTNRDCLVLENSLGSRCSTFQTCDHAVLLSGGWNRQLSDVSTYNNVFNVKRLLMAHGFLENNIEMFYANGQEETTGTDEEIETYYSSSLKTSMRNHIRTLCDSEHCSDTVFIYMNSPTRSDGSSLLWDTFDNGLYDETEVYSTRDLMRDIAHCAANRVVIMADQSYGGALVAAAEARFTSLQNVVILTSDDNFNWNTTTKDRLTKYLLRNQHNDICLNDFKSVFYHTHKAPVFVGSKTNLMNHTLVGGPCTGKATSLSDPETYKYRGCSLSPLI